MISVEISQALAPLHNSSSFTSYALKYLTCCECIELDIVDIILYSHDARTAFIPTTKQISRASVSHHCTYTPVLKPYSITHTFEKKRRREHGNAMTRTFAEA